MTPKAMALMVFFRNRGFGPIGVTNGRYVVKRFLPVLQILNVQFVIANEIFEFDTKEDARKAGRFLGVPVAEITEDAPAGTPLSTGRVIEIDPDENGNFELRAILNYPPEFELLCFKVNKAKILILEPEKQLVVGTEGLREVAPNDQKKS